MMASLSLGILSHLRQCWLCLHTCICMYIYMYTCTHTLMHAYIHLHIYIYIYIWCAKSSVMVTSLSISPYII